MTSPKPDPIVDRVERDIARWGWSPIHVMPSEDTVDLVYPFTYTVGLWPDHPEIIIVALRPEVAHLLIAGMVSRIQTGGTYEHDHIYPGVIESLDVAIRQVGAKPSRELLRLAHRLSPYDDPPQAVQMVWPDPHNRFPWEPDYDVENFPQQILGLES